MKLDKTSWIGPSLFYVSDHQKDILQRRQSSRRNICLPLQIIGKCHFHCTMRVNYTFTADWSPLKLGNMVSLLSELIWQTARETIQLHIYLPPTSNNGSLAIYAVPCEAKTFTPDNPVVLTSKNWTHPPREIIQWEKYLPPISSNGIVLFPLRNSMHTLSFLWWPIRFLFLSFHNGDKQIAEVFASHIKYWIKCYYYSEMLGE